jgi:hypothetical protein
VIFEKIIVWFLIPTAEDTPFNFCLLASIFNLYTRIIKTVVAGSVRYGLFLIKREIVTYDPIGK